MNHRYFILTSASYLKINNQGIVDLPQDFVNSSSQDKHIKLLNMTVLKDNEYYPITFHSPSLCDGNPSQYNFFITTYNVNYETIKKKYPISSKSQHIVFSFRNMDGEEIDISQLKFIIELDLVF